MEVIMKKRLLFIGLAIMCIISISINVLSAINNNHAKKEFVNGTYHHLVNISKILENMTSSLESNDTDSKDNNLSILERECIQLDDSIYGLSALSSHYTTSSYKFEDFNRVISSVIAANDNSPEKIMNSILTYKDQIQELLKKLSPHEVLIFDEYGVLTVAPNYSLGIKQIINLVSDTLANMETLSR